MDTATTDVRVHGFLDAQKFTLYLDTSGDALIKRNLRKNSGEAPLRISRRWDIATCWLEA